MGTNGPKMPIFGKKCQFGQNLAVFGPKILISMGVSKSFRTHITEEPPRHLFSHLFLVGHWIKWAKFGGFSANNSFFGGDAVKLLAPSNQGTNGTPLLCAMCNFDLKFWIFGAKSHFFCFGIAIFVNRAYHQFTQGYNSPMGTTPKNFRIRARGHFLGLTPVFGRFWPFPL